MIEKNNSSILPDDDPSCGRIILAGGVILVVSETVSIHERIALIVVDEIDFIFELELILLTEITGVLRVGVRLRKLTRFKND
jgi:hypothetical protein